MDCMSRILATWEISSLTRPTTRVVKLSNKYVHSRMGICLCPLPLLLLQNHALAICHVSESHIVKLISVCLHRIVFPIDLTPSFS
jgi:hypothetical protein